MCVYKIKLTSNTNKRGERAERGKTRDRKDESESLKRKAKDRKRKIYREWNIE